MRSLKGYVQLIFRDPTSFNVLAQEWEFNPQLFLLLLFTPEKPYTDKAAWPAIFTYIKCVVEARFSFSLFFLTPTQDLVGARADSV